MDIRIASRATSLPFHADEAGGGPAARPLAREAPPKNAREAVIAQNKLAAASHPIADSQAAAVVAALLRQAIVTQAGAALASHGKIDSRRVAALLD